MESQSSYTRFNYPSSPEQNHNYLLLKAALVLSYVKSMGEHELLNVDRKLRGFQENIEMRA